jgi:hypothetical protein
MKQSLEDLINTGQVSGPFWMSVRHDIQSKFWHVDNGAQSVFWRLAQRSGSRHFRALLGITVHINNASI